MILDNLGGAPVAGESREVTLEAFDLFSDGKVFVLSPLIALIQTVNMRGNLFETSRDFRAKWIQFSLQLLAQQQTECRHFVFRHRHMLETITTENILEVKQ